MQYIIGSRLNRLETNSDKQFYPFSNRPLKEHRDQVYGYHSRHSTDYRDFATLRVQCRDYEYWCDYVLQSIKQWIKKAITKVQSRIASPYACADSGTETFSINSFSSMPCYSCHFFFIYIVFFFLSAAKSLQQRYHAWWKQ